MPDTRPDILKGVRQVVAQCSPAISIIDDVALRQLGMSSLELVNVVLGVEARFDIQVPDDEATAANFASVVSIAQLVERIKWQTK
jgi:acyl carrier protein